MCVVGLVWGQNTTCDDIDPDVCRTFNAKVNVCADPCLSKLCPGTCNICRKTPRLFSTYYDKFFSCLYSKPSVCMFVINDMYGTC